MREVIMVPSCDIPDRLVSETSHILHRPCWILVLDWAQWNGMYIRTYGQKQS